MLEKVENLISSVTTPWDSTVQFSTNHKACKETKKYDPFTEKTTSTETVPEKGLMADLFKNNNSNNKPLKQLLKLLRELKEDVREVKKMISEQNKNIIKR